jgi:hypothetical protein
MRPGSSRAIKGRKPAWDRTEIVPEPAIYEVRAIGVKLSADAPGGPPGHFTVKTREQRVIGAIGACICRRSRQKVIKIKFANVFKGRSRQRFGGGDMDTDIIGLIVLAVTLVVVVILANRRAAKPFR